MALFALSSCDDMFDPAIENNRTLDDLTEESKYAYGLLMYGYNRLPILTSSQTDVATDDAVTNVKSSAYLNMATGSWASDNNPVSQWDACKDGIQYVNLFLSKVDEVKWAPSASSKDQMFKDRMKGEAYTLRAIFYFYLLQAHAGYDVDGNFVGVPMFTVPEDGSSDYNQARTSFAECISQCIADCNEAIKLLPADYQDIKDSIQIPAEYRKLGAEVSGYNLVFGDKSRNLISRKVARAVKAQIALFASSPAFREHSNLSSATAAAYCAEAINELDSINGLDGFDRTGNTWYKNKTKLDPSASEMKEIIWREDRHNTTALEKENFPPTLEGNGVINPSQNLVDAFPMMNGRPITDPASGYDPKNPYANRDPRLANTVLYHGVTYGGKVICTGYDIPAAGPDYRDNINNVTNSTRTGYYMIKHLREDVADESGQGKLKERFHIYARLRYTEIFLAYAEAANDAWGPTGHPDSIKYSAYDVIKAIRERAGVGMYNNGIFVPGHDEYLEECSANKEKMAELIRNERRIELCFENKRFWDLRRWMMPLNETVRGMRITLDPDKTDGTLIYTPIDVEERNFDNDYQIYGPLPKNEVLKWSNLKQNKGW